MARSAGIAVIVGSVGSGGCAARPGSDAAKPDASVLDGLNFLLFAALPVAIWWLWRADVIRPESLARHRKRDLNGSPWWVWWIGALLMLFAQGAGATLGVAVGQRYGGDWGPVASAVGASLGGLAMGLWLIWLFGSGPMGARSGLSLRFRVRDAAGGLLGFIAVLPIMALVTVLSVLVAKHLTGRPIDPIAHETLKVIKDSPWSLESWGLIVAAVALAPVVEEIMFRGMLQSGFLRTWGRPWVSVIAASVLFAAVHVGAVGEARHALVPLFVLGVCLGVAFERTGRLWVPITMHATFNAVNVAMTLMS